jgi:hypothetical protein
MVVGDVLGSLGVELLPDLVEQVVVLVRDALLNVLVGLIIKIGLIFRYKNAIGKFLIISITNT